MLNPDFHDILSEFCAAKVEFLLVGAYALAAHGLPRATGDIDLWVRPDLENAERVMRALAGFGAPMQQILPQDFSTPGTIFQIGLAPRRIDVLTLIDGVEFEEAWLNRIEIEVDGLKIFTLSHEHLLVNKKSTGRDKDLMDARWLEETA